MESADVSDFCYTLTMFFIVKTVVLALALLGVAEILPGFTVINFYVAFIGALVLGILNALVRPILIFITLPITLLTLGLFIFVINTGLLLFVDSFVDGITIDGFLPAFFGALILSTISTILNKILK